MLLLILALISLIFSAICFWRYRWHLKRDNTTDYNVGMKIFIIIAIIIFGISYIVTGIAYVMQVSDFEDIKKFQKVEKIYQVKAKKLTAEFAKYLAQMYPEHEKNIYEKIIPDKVDLYLIKYPELRTSETLLTLVAESNKLQCAIYDQQIAVEEFFKNTRLRLRNPWLVTSMLPTE